jgi:cation diffusion facilitator family transporter
MEDRGGFPGGASGTASERVCFYEVRCVMTTQPIQSEGQALAEKEKRRAAFSSVVAAVFLTVLKIAVGLLTGSLGILAEALHSGLDLVAALVTFFAVRLADRPPDDTHTFGYGKVENLSALIETILLLITCVWIIYEAIQRLVFRTVEIEASIWAFAVIILSIFVDVNRSRLLHRVAKKHHSQALEADALHFSTDVWSSSVVLLGLALVWLSDRLGPGWEFLVKADAVAALGVAVIVIWVSLQLGRRTVNVLLDATPPGLLEAVTQQALSVPGVQSVGPVRVRQSGPRVFVDLTAAVDRAASLHHAHEIATAIETHVLARVPRADVVVHVDPIARSDESLVTTLGAIAARYELRIHNIHAHDVRGQLCVDLHAEVAEDLSLGAAHDLVTQFEGAVQRELPSVTQINTHMEPRAAPVLAATSEEDLERMRREVEAALETIPGLVGCHNLTVRSGPDGLDVAFHCQANPDLPITAAHDLAERAEQHLRREVPGLGSVLVHVEPA